MQNLDDYKTSVFTKHQKLKTVASRDPVRQMEQFLRIACSCSLYLFRGIFIGKWSALFLVRGWRFYRYRPTPLMSDVTDRRLEWMEQRRKEVSALCCHTEKLGKLELEMVRVYGAAEQFYKIDWWNAHKPVNMRVTSVVCNANCDFFIRSSGAARVATSR